MDKTGRKIEVIKKYIHNVSKYSTYAYGSIPRDIAQNACNSYGGAISLGNIIGLVDTTITGNGKNGLIFTLSNVYFNNGMFGEKGVISYREIAKTRKIPGGIFCSDYNQQALIDLLSLLANIEGKDLAGTIDDFNDRANTAIDKANDILNTVSKGLGVLQSFLEDE